MEEKINRLFELSNQQASKVSVSEVTNWVNASAVSIGVFAGLKLLITKKITMILSLSTLVSGITVTGLLLLNQPETAIEKAVTHAVKPEKAIPFSELNTIHPEPKIESPKNSSSEEMEVYESLLFTARPIPDFLPKNSGFVPQIKKDDPSTDAENFDAIEANGFIHFSIVSGSENKVSVLLPEGTEEKPEDYYHISNGFLKLEGDNENNNVAIVVMVRSIRKLELEGFCKVEMEEAIDLESLLLEINGFSEAIIGSTIRSLDLEMMGETKLDFTGDIDQLHCNVGGSSTMEYSGNCNEINAELSGASNMKFSGSAKVADIKITGLCDFKGAEFLVENLKIDVSGDSKGEVNALSELNVTLSGLSKLTYSGDPVVTKDISGESKLKKR